MKNFPIEKDGKEYWISRSCAAVAYVYSFHKGKMMVLVNKRGPGLPNNVGKWNAPSGFVDYDETTKECAAREVFEETGVKLNPTDFHLEEIDDRPSRPGQNILFRFSAVMKYTDAITNENCEKDEVDEVKWIPVDDIDKYDWTSEAHVFAMKVYAMHRKGDAVTAQFI